jgi:hypothetical protein
MAPVRRISTYITKKSITSLNVLLGDDNGSKLIEHIQHRIPVQFQTQTGGTNFPKNYIHHKI